MRYTYKTKGVCPTEISFDINDNIITNIKFNRRMPRKLSSTFKSIRR